MSNSFLLPAVEGQPKAGPVLDEKQLWSLLPATTVSCVGTVLGSGGG